MVKKGRISKIEAHYINTNSGLTDEELAKELDRTLDSVQRARMNLYQPEDAVAKDVEKDEDIENVPRTVQGDKAVRNLRRGYVAMTGAEAERSDTIAQRFTTRKTADGVRPAREE